MKLGLGGANELNFEYAEFEVTAGSSVGERSR